MEESEGGDWREDYWKRNCLFHSIYYVYDLNYFSLWTVLDMGMGIIGHWSIFRIHSNADDIRGDGREGREGEREDD